MAVVTREDYFEVAMELLAESGARSLKITALCRRFGVTVGSFYHHFGSYDAFVADLLGHWQREQTERVIALSTTAADPVQQIRLLKRLVLDLPHDAEAAIRSWAATNDRVHTVQRHVDDERFTALRKVIAGVVGARPRRNALLRWA